MTVDVVVLNGGSSSGKTSIGRRLQELLPLPWLLLGVDDLIHIAPSSLVSYGPNGEVVLSDHWRALETAWSRGVATMARAGAGVVIDDVFLDGAASQQRTNDHLEGLDGALGRCPLRTGGGGGSRTGARGSTGRDGSRAGRDCPPRGELRRRRRQQLLLRRRLRPPHRRTRCLTR